MNFSAAVPAEDRRALPLLLQILQFLPLSHRRRRRSFGGARISLVFCSSANGDGGQWKWRCHRDWRRCEWRRGAPPDRLLINRKAAAASFVFGIRPNGTESRLNPIIVRLINRLRPEAFTSLLSPCHLQLLHSHFSSAVLPSSTIIDLILLYRRCRSTNQQTRRLAGARSEQEVLY